jgi:hypothetical protein
MIHRIVSSGAVMVQGVEGVTKVFVSPWSSVGVVDFRKRYVMFLHDCYYNKSLAYYCFVCKYLT